MIIDELMRKPLPKIPKEIYLSLKSNSITPTEFRDKDNILRSEELQKEAGYKKLSDGSYIVSMYCPMPNVTPEMIEWWFWWHPQKQERYRVWFPGEHCGIGYSKKQKKYFAQKQCPKFENNTQYPLEKIGGTLLPLRIDFVSPEEFGFSKSVMNENGMPLIVCGHVGVFGGLVMHTQMAHIFKKTDDGLYMISRFWLGDLMKSSIIRKIFINEKTARGMAEHCCVEYRNLCEILPILYKEYHDEK